MMHIRSILFLSSLFIPFLNFAQSHSLSDTPRIIVYGEASVQADADLIYCWLNIYDNYLNYDYNTPYNNTKFKADQKSMLNRLGVKDYMSNPLYADLNNYNESGPFELKFTKKSQYDAVMKKIQDNYNPEISVTMEVYKSEIDESRKKQLYRQTLSQAIADATSKAQYMAEALKVNIASPVYIEEIPTSSSATNFGWDNSEWLYDYSAGTGNDKMKVTVSSKVQLQYLIQ